MVKTRGWSGRDADGQKTWDKKKCTAMVCTSTWQLHTGTQPVMSHIHSEGVANKRLQIQNEVLMSQSDPVDQNRDETIDQSNSEV